MLPQTLYTEAAASIWGAEMKHVNQMSRGKIIALVLIVVISTSVPMWPLWEFSVQPIRTEEILNYDANNGVERRFAS